MSRAKRRRVRSSMVQACQAARSGFGAPSSKSILCSEALVAGRAAPGLNETFAPDGAWTTSKGRPFWLLGTRLTEDCIACSATRLVAWGRGHGLTIDWYRLAPGTNLLSKHPLQFAVCTPGPQRYGYRQITPVAPVPTMRPIEDSGQLACVAGFSAPLSIADCIAVCTIGMEV